MGATTSSVEAGQADAQNSLGLCYMNGRGITADAREAVKWWTRADAPRADAEGHAGAQYNLGLCYATARGTRAQLQVKAIDRGLTHQQPTVTTAAGGGEQPRRRRAGRPGPARGGRAAARRPAA